MGGLHHVARQANFEAKESNESRSGIRSGWGVVADGRHVGGSGWSDGRYADRECGAGNFSRRRRNFGRQPGDFLCVRQRKRRSTSSRLTTRQEDARPRRLRNPPRRRRGRLRRLRRLRWLRRRPDRRRRAGWYVGQWQRADRQPYLCSPQPDTSQLQEPAIEAAMTWT
jgi:hypothetical protein